MLATLALSGCGPVGLKVDPEFAPYVQKFIQGAIDHNRVEFVQYLLVDFVPEIPSSQRGYVILGECDGMETPHREVHISKVEWIDLSPIEQEELIYHELGHCVLDREHTTDMFSNGMPVSMMYPYMNVLDPWYVSHKDYYWNEMFSN
jgi:hypothetical protein